MAFQILPKSNILEGNAILANVWEAEHSQDEAQGAKTLETKKQFGKFSPLPPA